MSRARDASLAHLLTAAAEAHPDAAAVREGEASVRYDGLAARAGGLAAALRGVGVAPGDRVAILIERSTTAVAAQFGAWAAGAAPVVINDRLRPRQIEHVLKDAGARALLTTPQLLAELPRPLAQAPPIVNAADAPPAPWTPVARKPADLAQIIYTSGSTGLPKGVMYEHGAIRHGVDTVAGYLGLVADDRVGSVLSFSGVYGLNQLLCGVRVGATLCIERAALPADVVRWLWRESVSVLAAVPPLWLGLLAIPEFETALPRLRQMQNAGGHLPVEAVRRLRHAQPQAALFLQYGMTETWRSTFLDPSEIDRRPGSMGRGMPGADIHVVRPDGAEAGVDEPGELVHAGPTIASGYWHAPEAGARVFRPCPGRPAARAVYSGDIVRRDAEGFLHYVGRRDRMIKTLGFRVGPDEIGDVLHASGQVADAAVTGEPDPARGERIVAHVVLASGGSLETLRRTCRLELPPYMVPTRFVVHDHLPRLPGGKHDVRALSGEPPAEGDHAAP